MICIAALIIFAILGIFSAKYRKLAAEAADCVFRRITLRKCETGLDKRIKNKITGNLAKKKPKLAKFLFKYFEVLSWIFIILFVWSLASLVVGGVNFVKYGNCNGPTNPEGFCIFDPTGANSQYSGTEVDVNTNIVYPTAGTDPDIGPKDAKVTIIHFGCVTCAYTKAAEPLMKQLVDKYSEQSVRFVFKDYPLPAHQTSLSLAKALYCAEQQGKYFETRAYMFNNQGNVNITTMAQQLGLDENKLNTCSNSASTFEAVMTNVLEGRDAHVYGTPTVFINNKTIVGTKDISEYTKIIDAELKK